MTGIISTQTPLLNGYIDTSSKIATLIGSSSNQELYELSNSNSEIIGIRRRFYNPIHNYYDVDFIKGNIENIPYAGEYIGNLRQYTIIRDFNGNNLVISPDNYMSYINDINNGSNFGPSIHTIKVYYNGIPYTIMAHRDNTGSLSGVALQQIDSNVQSIIQNIINLIKTAEPIQPIVTYKPMVNKLCVVIHCGIAGIIDIATCIVEVSGPQVAVGWILCGGQSIMSGCSCLECWGDCNAS
jgi:hypothetical protein